MKDDVRFNAHLRALTAPLQKPVTQELVDGVVSSAGLVVEELDRAVFKSDFFFWRGYVSTTDESSTEWWLMIHSAENKTANVEMRWCTNIEDSSDGLTFDDVKLSYACAARTIKHIHDFLCDSSQPCVIEDDVTFNVHVRTSTAPLKTLPKREHIEDMVQALSLSFEVDEQDTDFGPDSFVWCAGAVTLPSRTDVSHWWIYVSSLDDSSVELDMRLLNSLDDVSSGHTFAEVTTFYAFAKTVLQRIHEQLSVL